jgi:CRISPR-associated protein Cst2
MAHLSGLLLIDCPASALNNAGTTLELEDPDRRYDNWTAVKKIATRQGTFPYVSAQAFRYWLRESLKEVEGWTSSPIFREAKIAYTAADPISWAEDDLFGYMRAPAATKAKKAAAEGSEVSGTLTRISPFKVSTLISIASVKAMGLDFGTMSRGEGDPVPFAHEFYRTTLVGMFSLDLRMAGRFYVVERTGYRHLDEQGRKRAEEKGLAPYDGGKAYTLDLDARKTRVKQLLEGLARINGGAKQSVHYTDVSPKFLIMGIAKGGNHLFGTAVGADHHGLPKFNPEAIAEVAQVYQGDLLSGFYAGLTRGYLDEQRAALETALSSIAGSTLAHPVQAIRALVGELDQRAEEWLA